MADQNTIECPSCGEKIDVNEILYHQLKDQVKQEFSDKLAEQKKKYDDKAEALKAEKAKLDEEKEKIQEQISDGVRDKLKTEKQKLEKQLRDQIQDEQSEQLKALQDELQNKSEQVKEFHKVKGEVQKLKREKDELKDKIEAEAEQKLTEKLKEEREKIKKTEEEKVELKLVEKNNLIKQLSEKLKEAQRKVEQGSMQAQGEAQEIAIEDYLRENFPLDTIDEVIKGVRGADCLQTINTRAKQNCGSIYYESKRTKTFSPAWIEKFRNDMRDKGANIGVLVTDAMPVEMDRMGQKDGIWICTLAEFKGLCFVLRESVIQISNAIATQENKGDKMVMLYDFLTSNEFRFQIEAIVEGFTQMRADLEKERTSMQGHWKRREKQIDKVVLNTNFMYNSFRGIAGNAIQTVQALELGIGEEEVEKDIDTSALENLDLGEDEEKEE